MLLKMVAVFRGYGKLEMMARPGIGKVYSQFLAGGING
jgi:hypothetical protein